MKKIMILASFVMAAFLGGCGGNENASTGAQSNTGSGSDGPASYDPKRGEGKHSDESLAIPAKLDVVLADGGEKISGVKCFSCHKVTDEKLVGPGWKDVTTRRTAAWIMNFITNPDPMIDKDPQAQAMLELCLVRMPNQNLSDDEARQILEFMRKNDGVN
jgi:hypothetical protein